jgi:hypothetical protein
MLATFSKKIPDELYVDSFKNNNVMNLEYDGPSVLYILVNKSFGLVEKVLETSEDRYNSDLSELITLEAAAYPDVAYLITNNNIEERVFETETLVDGTTYEKIVNPSLNDFYRIKYDLNNKKWIWEVTTVEPKSIRNITAERYRNYINENLDKVSSDINLKKLATDYLVVLDNFEKTGKGSIPSWKIIDARISDVPMIPQELVAAINVLP